MTFNYDLRPFPRLESVIINDRRYYSTPTGEKYPSVTTVLSERLDKSWLYEWRQRVGEETAKRISAQASRRGTKVHSLLEKFLRNEPYQQELFPIYMEDFNRFKTILTESVSTIYGIEESLYSHIYKLAGRTDLIASFNNIPSIIDFKTSKNIKKEEDILSYFLQSTIYSLMVEELTTLSIPQIVILISCSDSQTIQTIIKPRDDYVTRVKELLNINK